MTAYYLDTSALIKRYVNEAGSRWLRVLLNEKPSPAIVTSHLVIVGVIIMMSTNVISAVYESGMFRPLQKPVGLVEHQEVHLYLVTDDALPVEPFSPDETARFVAEMMGAWSIQDPTFRRWLAEEASLYDGRTSAA